MGCSSSSIKTPQATAHINENITENNQPSSKVIDILPRKSEILFSGIKDGMAIMCLDIFNSKYTGEKMARWRAATIKEFNHESLQVLIHFEGWKDKHNIILQLPDDLGRLAPAEILTDQEKLEGHFLNESQYDATEVYLKTGLLQFEDSVIEQPQVSESTSTYFPGQLIDILDIYKPKNKPNVVYKWRPGEVKEVYGPHVTIHYVGWGDEWDEVIDTTVESKRIRPAGSQLPRRSPNKNPKIDGSPSSKVTDRNNKNSTKEEELVLYKERRKSSSHVEEQRRGSFTNTYPSNGNSSQQSILRHHKVSVNGRSQRLVPESEILTESSIPPKESQKLPTNSQSLMPPKDSHPPTRELGRNLSDPGRHFSQTFSVHPESDDDNTIPPEIDESEYYETLRLETAFFEAMNRKGYHIVEMDGDGNCLFRSVAHQIYLDEDRHYELRLQCVQHLEKYADRFSSFYAGNFREYLENMKNPGVWGDDIEIKALEEMTDRPIYIYSSHSDSIAPLVTNFDEKEIMKGVQPIILSYHGKNHYNSVYDERTPLPLEKRNTQLLLNLRQKSFHK